MKKIIIILIGVILVLAFGLVYFLFLRFPTPRVTINNENQPGIMISSPKIDEVVSSPLTITGQVIGKDHWVGFEGQVGTVKLLDEDKNVLASGILSATSEWTQPAVSFQAILNFNLGSVVGKVPESKLAILAFENENPSGLPTNSSTYSLPIKIIGSSSNQMNISVFFLSKIFDPSMLDCSKVFPTTRTIIKTVAVGQATLEELFKGPTSQEATAGYFTTIPVGVKIQKLTIERGIAKVDLSKELEQGVGGSCRVAAIYAQITQTLKQFSTVQKVIISIDGRTEDILQP